jgi:hypothetical protein
VLALVHFLGGLCARRELRAAAAEVKDEDGGDDDDDEGSDGDVDSAGDVDAPALLGGWPACRQLVRELCATVGIVSVDTNTSRPAA